MNEPTVVVIKARRALPLFGRHPWVFDNAVERTDGHAEPGSLVRVLSHEGQFIAWGLINPQSRIRVRLYSWIEERPFDVALLTERLDRAIAYRHATLGLADPRGACRLVYSEADGLSGLCIDRYGDVLVVQTTSLAMSRLEQPIVEFLTTRLAPRAVYRRTEQGIRELEGLETMDGQIAGEPITEPIRIVENSLELLVDVRTGQKTGAYLDQRENRWALCAYTRDQNVLDVFCYGGAFGLSAMKSGGAASMLGIDVSKSAIDLARSNALLNGVSAEFREQSAFTAMEELVRSGRRFGVVICDPPKFARTRAAAAKAVRGYDQINRLAIRLLERGGFLVTCSCSGHVSATDFRGIVVQASQAVGRELYLLEQRSQAPDHPVGTYCLETGYLKCLFARCVE